MTLKEFLQERDSQYNIEMFCSLVQKFESGFGRQYGFVFQGRKEHPTCKERDILFMNPRDASVSFKELMDTPFTVSIIGSFDMLGDQKLINQATKDFEMFVKSVNGKISKRSKSYLVADVTFWYDF